jgi:hypothetical protein
MLVPEIALSWWIMSIPMTSVSRPVHRPRIVDIDTVDDKTFEPADTPGHSATGRSDEPTAPADDDSDNSESPESPPDDTADENGPSPGAKTVYRGLITPEIVRAARSFLDLPMGAERESDVDGRHFVFVLERHYHPPGFVGAPTGWHKGVTVYEAR